MNKLKSLLEAQSPMTDFSAEAVFKRVEAINHLLYGEPKMYVGKQKEAEQHYQEDHDCHLSPEDGCEVCDKRLD